MCTKCLNEISDEGLETVEGEGTDEDLFDDDGSPREDE